jgi:hypothetical protein
LPALTRAVVWFGHLNWAYFGLPALFCFALLMLADIVAGRRLGRRGRLGWLYWAWFAAVITPGMLALLLIVVSVLLPVFKMGSTVGWLLGTEPAVELNRCNLLRSPHEALPSWVEGDGDEKC